MEDSLIVANEIPHGYTWTLASRLGDALLEAELRYGKRNKNFTLLGVEFCDTGPRIWYPKSREFIIVQLSLDAMKFEDIAIYQLAHESIHLLDPSGDNRANVLEEGLAVYHSWFFVNKILQINGKKMTSDKRYYSAGLLVEKLLYHNPDFFKILRRDKRHTWDMTAKDIRQMSPGLSVDEAETLSSPFHPKDNL